MRTEYVSAKLLLWQIKKDAMLGLALLVPFVVGGLIRFGVPMLEGALTAHFQTEWVLRNFYPLFDLFLAMLTPMMFSFSFAMILLEELDDKVARYVMITPLGKGGYLFSRVGLPALLSLLITPILLGLFHLSQGGVVKFCVATFLGVLLGVIVSLMIVSLSTNKLEGMAVTKLSAMLMLGVLPPFFLEGAAQYFFAVLPSYWLGRCMVDGGVTSFVLGLAVSGLWIAALAGKLDRKLSQ